MVESLGLEHVEYAGPGQETNTTDARAESYTNTANAVVGDTSDYGRTVCAMKRTVFNGFVRCVSYDTAD